MEEIATKLRTFGAKDPRIQALYLFGSRARGDAHEASDADVGVLFFESQPLWDTLTMEADLEALLQCPVDLIDLGKARPFLALDVLRGERIYCAAPDACDKFELYVMRRAGDLAPFERMRRKAVLAP
jgi:predicted nucleotidyltransferase